MKTSAEIKKLIKEENKRHRVRSKKLKESLARAIKYEETHPNDTIVEQETIMQKQLASYVKHEWKKGEKGYFIWDFGGLRCGCLEILAIFDKPEGRVLNCGPYGPGVPVFYEEDFFTDPLTAIADYYFDHKLHPDKRLPPLLDYISKEELLHEVREWYFEVKEKIKA